MRMETNGYTLLPFPVYMAGSQGRFLRFLRTFLRRAHWSIAVHLENSSLCWLSCFPVSLNWHTIFCLRFCFQGTQDAKVGTGILKWAHLSEGRVSCSSPIKKSFPCGFTVKNPPATWKTWVQSLGGEDPLEKETVTDSSILTWRILWTQEPSGLQSMDSQRVGHD